MNPSELGSKLIEAATPLFAMRGFKGVNVREIARAAGVNPSLISYHFGGKEGLYAAVLEEQFAGLARFAAVADSGAGAASCFAAYLYECGVCYYCGCPEEFSPKTASADRKSPECPRCLTNDATLFTHVGEQVRVAS